MSDADEDHARSAAEAVATYDQRFTALHTEMAAVRGELGQVRGALAAITTSIGWLQWGMALHMALTLALFAKLVLGWPRP